jgi:hypothetical protein
MEKTNSKDISIILRRAIGSEQINGLDVFPYSEEYTVTKSDYMVSMARKAKTHGARDYCFVSPKPVEVEKMSEKKRQILENTYKKEWVEFRNKLESILKSDTPSVSDFQKIQIEILSKLIKDGKGEAVPITNNKTGKKKPQQKSRHQLVVDSCKEKLGDKLQETERFFALKCCPKSGNDQLFKKLGLSHQEAKGRFSYEEQLKYITDMDRGLLLLPDSRCVNFKPTKLQRDIMRCIDDKQSIVVCSPASSGKTMVSLYLVHKMKEVKKRTLYICPNKPVANEFSLFAYHQKTEWSIGTEDFFDWGELSTSDVSICTVTVAMKIFLFPKHTDFIDQIGGIIFDEFPRVYEIHPEETVTLLLLATSKRWQTMILSATIPPELTKLVTTLVPNCVSIETTTIVRPTDLVFRDCETIKIIPTTSQYPTEMTSDQNGLSRALRVPVSLSEFNLVFKDCTRKRKEKINSALPQAGSKVLSGYDMTKFTFIMRSEENSANATNSTDKSVSTSAPPPRTTAEEIYKLMKILADENRLPALFFHSEKQDLSLWHSEITKFLQRDFPDTEKKISNDSSDEYEDNDEVDLKEQIAIFGYFGDSQLASIFKHRSDHSGSESILKYKLGIKGRRVKKSDFYPGIKLGLGIHHHGIDSNVREAVESGVRMGYVKVVLCDATFAFGLNMPVKSVVFIGSSDIVKDEEDELQADVFVQASGRAGRWGLDKEGSIFFLNCTEEEKERIWKPFNPPKREFPIGIRFALALYAGSNSVKEELPKWLNLDIPQWEWNFDTAHEKFTDHCNTLIKLGLVYGETFSITHAGKAAISLYDEGNNSLFAGYLISKYKYEIFDYVKSEKDYLFVVSHFLKKWRAVLKGAPTLESDSSVSVSQELRDLMKNAQQEMQKISNIEIIPTSEITSLYVVFPNLTGFNTATHHPFDLQSYCAHFIKKMQVLQKIANLPFGDIALLTMQKSIPNM